MLVEQIPDIYTYGMLVTGLSFPIYFLLNLKKEKIPFWVLLLSSFAIVLFAFFGARLMWSLEVPDVDLSDIFDFSMTGFRLLGAVVFAIIAFIVTTIIYKKIYNIDPNKILGIGLEGAFLAFAFAKFSCFLNGCCYGIPTDLPWGMVFPDDKLGLARHPTQLYETLALLFIFAISIITRKKMSTSQRYALTIFLYIVTRMLIEPFRDEAALFADGPTRTIYYFLLVICAIVVFKNKLLMLLDKLDDIMKKSSSS